MKVGLLTLGCARNLVDSEVALGGLLRAGYEYEKDVRRADIAIVNTCGFTGEAKRESIDAIYELVALKKQKRIRSLVIMGCLSQRYGPELAAGIREADAVFGAGSFGDLAGLLAPLQRREKVFEVEPRPRFLLNRDSPRACLGAAHSTYVKVSEGCINACSYCAIPMMKGPHRSRPIDDILAETARLRSESRISEINLIGQDVAAYGYDLERKFLLARLLDELAAAAPEVWFRVLYAHPAHVTPELTGVFLKRRNVCRYVDLPIEHSHPETLRRMNRGVSRERMDRVIADLREIPGMVLRTAVIVGFPGESEEEFRDLLDTIKRVKFERLGAFVYSREEGTRAFAAGAQIDEALKRSRFDAVMAVQREITAAWNASRIGTTITALVDEKAPEPGVYLARSEADAPEVDGQVIVHSKRELRAGAFVAVRVTDAFDHDVVGEA